MTEQRTPSAIKAKVDCFIGMGSNQNQPDRQLMAAFDALQQHPRIELVARSRLYQTPPLGGLAQASYVNAVAHIRTDLPAEVLLTELQAIEHRQGRVRTGERWGARTLDLDLLLYGQQKIRTEHLQVPHYALHERNFVVFPLLEIQPDCQVPGLGPLEAISRQLTMEGMVPLEDPTGDTR